MSLRARGLAVTIVVLGALAIPPTLAVAVLDGSPMVARAGAGAEREASYVVGTTTPPSEAEALAGEVIRLANAERVAAGRRELVVHPAVMAAASGHSADQAARQQMSHIGSDGSDGGDRLTRAGFEWGAWGENVAVGQRTAAAVVDAWMGSSGHRANILSGSFTTIGVGAAVGADGRIYWTMLLAA